MGFQAFALFALCINYIFGAGVLSIPYSFLHGGLIASGITLVVSSFLSLVTALWLIEIQARAQALKKREREDHDVDVDNTEEELFQITETSQMEISEMCVLFIGNKARNIYDISISVFVLSSAWMYASISAMSLVGTIPILSKTTESTNANETHSCDISSHSGFLWSLPEKRCYYDYLLYLLIFCLAQAYLISIGMKRLQSLQQLLTIVGLIALTTMIITVIVAMTEEGIAIHKFDTKVIFLNVNGYGAVFSTFVFAQLCHMGVPTLSQLVPGENKMIMYRVLIVTICTTTILYLLLGSSCALFFGQDDTSTHKGLKKVISLNWIDYTGKKSQFNRSAFASVISYFIRLYPVITCGAAFPLYSITIGNSWYKSVHITSRRPERDRDGDDSIALIEPLISAEQGEESRSFLQKLPVSGFQFIGCFFPVLAASLMADVSFILLLVGYAGFFIAFFIPIVLQIKSKSVCSHVFGRYKTVYDSRISEQDFVYVTLVFGIFAMVLSTITVFL